VCANVDIGVHRSRPRQLDMRKSTWEALLHALGHAVGEYVGGGQGDTSPAEDADADADADAETEFPECEDMDEDASPDANDHHEEQEDSSDLAHPLISFFDCEATGLSIYDDHITEIAAKVVGVPLSSVSAPSFSDLVHTPRKVNQTIFNQQVITLHKFMHSGREDWDYSSYATL